MLRNDLLSPANYSRTDAELEEWLLLCIFVAGKSSKTMSQKLDRFLELLGRPELPITYMKSLTGGNIKDLLLRAGTGQYERLTGCLFMLAQRGLDLRRCTSADLESIHGIGMKTSRFFLTYSREHYAAAVLDTHILTWLREIGIEAPKSTPTGQRYIDLEAIYLKEAAERGVSDFDIWSSRQKSW